MPNEVKADLNPAHELPQGEHQESLPKPKRHRLRWTLVTLVVVLIILPLLALGYSGVWHIPGLTQLFGSDKPIDLGVHPTEADLASALADNPMMIEAEPGTFYWSQNKSFAGQVAIDDEHSSEEVTAFIQHYHGDGRFVRDIQVRFREGGMEISAFVSPYIKAPVYVDVDVTRTGTQSVSLNLQKAKVGRLTVPEKYYNQIEEAAQDVLNREIAAVPGFRIDDLQYTDNAAYLLGSLPAMVTPLGGEQELSEFIN
ncbi:MAG: hypothetical protein H6760_03150 [Candidatus Nomurabacteria bacterium]|nr:MAG: hypothetical protein H6760_03150 [Candidatus Nomurabacteria bacterium]